MDLKTLLSKSKFIYDNNDDTDNKCSICMEHTKNKLCRKLECSHVFHCECIDKWFSNNSSCPLCRHEIKNDLENNIQSNRFDNELISYNTNNSEYHVNNTYKILNIIKIMCLIYLLKKSPNRDIFIGMGFGTIGGFFMGTIFGFGSLSFLIFSIGRISSLPTY